MRNRALFFVLLSAVLVACTSTGTSVVEREPQPVEVDLWTDEFPIADAWLRHQLPAGILSYQRIPHPLGLMSIPKGNIFDTALSSRANIESLINIQRGIVDNFGVDLPPIQFLDALRSPIEVVAIGAPPLTSIMLGATLSFRSNAEFESFIGQLGQMGPGIGLAAPLDEGGFGQIMLPPQLPVPVQIFVNFQESTGRFAIYGGLAADRVTFERFLTPAEAPQAHPMQALEAQIDDSGQGLFSWADASQMLQMGNGFLPPEVAEMINLLQIRSFGLGAGVADGKGRLKAMVDLQPGNVDRPLPVVNNRITATSVGDTRNLFLLSLPSSAEFARLEGIVLSHMPPEGANVWAQGKAAFAEATGTSIEEIFSAIGPELITISDQAGDYLGLHLNDPVLFSSLIDRWAAAGGFTVDERQVNGTSIRSMELPGAIGVPEAAFQSEAGPFLEIISRMRTRLYWIEDGDYLYLAGTPQLLIDRANLGADASVATWLDDTQRFDVSSSLIAMTGSAERLPSLLYNAYVSYMQVFSDLVGVEYDVWSMPTANQLALPDRGTLGFSLNLGEPYVSVELSYESHPAEILFSGGGMAAVAVAGIAAAVALPAYQDYTVRAQVSEGFGLAMGPRAAATQAYQNNGAAPADRASAGLSEDPTDSAGQFVRSVDVADGEIIVVYGNQADGAIAGETLVITLYSGSDGNVVYRCGHASPPAGAEPIGAESLDGTTIEAQYLPSACR